MKDSESEDGGHKRLRSSEMASRVITLASTRASAPATTVCRRVVRGGAATGGGATKSSATIRGRRSVRAAAEEPGAAAAAVRYDDIIAVLREAPIDGLDAAVDAVKLELTTGFYEHAVRRIDACRSAGDEAEADALDELCGRVMMASDRTFGAILPSLGDGSGEEIDGEASEALVTAGDLTPAQQEQLQRRWDGIAARLAAEGEANARLGTNGSFKFSPCRAGSFQRSGSVRGLAFATPLPRGRHRVESKRPRRFKMSPRSRRRSRCRVFPL